jgi:hypothetical protein
LHNVVDAQAYQVAAAQLAVNDEVEQRQFAVSMGQLQANADAPDLRSGRSIIWWHPFAVETKARGLCPEVINVPQVFVFQTDVYCAGFRIGLCVSGRLQMPGRLR